MKKNEEKINQPEIKRAQIPDSRESAPKLMSLMCGWSPIYSPSTENIGKDSPNQSMGDAAMQP